MVNLILQVEVPTIEAAESFLIVMGLLPFEVVDYMITDLKLQQLNEAD